MVQVLPPSPEQVQKEQFYENLGRGIGSATNAVFQHLAQKHQHKQKAQYFEGLMQKHPGDRSYELMSELAASPLSENQQNAFARSILGHRDNPFLEQQQHRLDRDSMSRLYNQKIREVDEEIVHGMYDVDKDALRAQKRQLQQDRDALFQGVRGSRQPATDVEDESEEQPEAPRKRVRFDFKNPKHIKARDKALRMSRGDRAKAEKMLRKVFDL